MSTRRKGSRQPTKADEKFAERRSRKAWAVVLSDESGRRVLWEILRLTGYDELLNVTGEPAAFALGKRAVGWGLREAIKRVDHRALRLMETECDPIPEPEPEVEEPEELAA